jgi:nucleoid DNA-binding protein
MRKSEIISRVAEFDYFDTKKQAEEFLNDFFDIIIETTSKGEEFAYAPYMKFDKFTSSVTGKSKLKMTPFKAAKDAFVK